LRPDPATARARRLQERTARRANMDEQNIPPPPPPPEDAPQPQQQPAVAGGNLTAQDIQNLVAAMMPAMIPAILPAIMQQVGQQQPAPLPPPPPPQQQQFVAVPGGNGGNNAPPWDLTKGDGLKIFQYATKGLDPRYDGDPAGLQDFLDDTQHRGQSYGWMDIMNVPTPNGIKKMTTSFGAITMEQVMDHATTYMAVDGRNKQASMMMVEFIHASLDKKTRHAMKQFQRDYTLNVGQEQVQVGPAILLKIIQFVNIETRATISNIELELHDLPKIMSKHQEDIKAFNMEVNSLLFELTAREEEAPKLVNELFRVYMMVSDSTFSDWIKRKKEDYLEDITIQYTNETLMMKALEKYKNIGDEWKQKSSNQLEFVAMKVELKKTKSTLQLLQDRVSNPRQQRNNNSRASISTPSGSAREKLFAWKDVHPKPGESHSKTFQGKEYIYCPNHRNCWVLKVNNKGQVHATSCEARKSNPPIAGQPSSAGTNLQSTRTAKALTMIMDEEYDQVSDDENDGGHSDL